MDSNTSFFQERRTIPGLVCGLGMRLQPGRRLSHVSLRNGEGLGFRENICVASSWCSALDGTCVRRLVADSTFPPKLCWWSILYRFPGIEDLELYPAFV